MTLKQFILLSSFILLFCCKNKDKINRATETNVAIAATKHINTKAELEYKIEAALGEGALWDYKNKVLYWIDIEGKSLYIYNPTNKTNRIIEMPSRIGTVVPVDSTTVLSALEDGVYKTNIESGISELFVDMRKQLVDRRLNDGKCDPKGRFWVGSMHMQQKKGEAQLYTISPNSHLEMKIDSVTISNGIVWTADKTKMYYIDTPTSEIKSYNYDNSTGHISNAQLAVRIPDSLGYPDGMTIDNEGMLWVGMWNGNAVLRFDPNTGKILQKIEVPAHNVTSCAFGGEELDILYITTARVDMSKEELHSYPLSGSLFKVKTGVKGVPCYHFNKQSN